MPQLAQTLFQRIEKDRSSVQSVAHNLQSLQGSFKQVAQDWDPALGASAKSMQHLLWEHEEALKERKYLDSEIARLGSQLGTLSSQLETLKKQTAQEEAEHAVWEEKAKNESEALDKQRRADEALKNLKHGNTVLEEHNAQVSEDVARMAEGIKALEQHLNESQNATHTLEEELLRQHGHALQCQQALAAREARLAEWNQLKQATRRPSEHMLKVKEEQQKVHDELTQKIQGLKARVKKARTNTATIHLAVLTTRAQRKRMEKQGKVELGNLRKLLGRLLSKEAAARTELNISLAAKQAADKDLASAQAEVARLQARLLEGKIAKLRANNTELKAEFQQAVETVQAAQASIVRLTEEAEQANATYHLLKKQTEEILQHAEEAAKESVLKVGEARNANVEAHTKLEEANLAANNAMLMDCNATWEAEHEDVLKELTDCGQVALQLKTVRAQVEALSGTIQADDAQEVVDD